MDSTDDRLGPRESARHGGPARAFPPGFALVLRLAAVVAGYYLTARLGLLIPYMGTHVSLVWLPTGVAVAAFRRWGPGMAPAVYLAAVAANASIGGPLWIAALVGFGNTAGTGLAAFLLQRWGFDDRLLRRRDVMAFFAAVVAGMLVTSSNGIAWQRVAGAPDAAQPGQAWLSWLVGDVVGALLAGVPLIAWSRRGAAQAFGGRQGAANVALQAVVLGCGLAVFSAWPDKDSALVFPLLALPFFLLGMLAMRGGIIASSTGVLALSMAAAWGTARGFGPFAAHEPRAGSLALWCYITAQGCTSLLICGMGMALQSSQRQFAAFLQNSPDGILVINERGILVHANAAFATMLGLDARALTGRPAITALQGAAGVIADLIAEGRPPATTELTLPRAGGEPLFVDCQVARYQKANSRWQTHVSLRDITARKLAQAQVATSEARLKAVTDNLPVLITYVDADEKLRFMNGTFHDWLGVDLAHAIDRPLADVVGPEHYAARREHLRAALAGERVEFEMVSHTLMGPRNLQTAYIPDLRPDGSVRGIFTLATDVTALKDVERELQRLARVDTLTGLANRRQFDELLEQALARSRRSKRPLALIFLDIDHFKTINDTHGHGVGDTVLKEFAARLQANLRETDVAARLSGDEFVVILDGLAAMDEATAVATKLLHAIREPLDTGARPLHFTASMGLAWLDGQAEVGAQELMVRADRALYRAKEGGRDGLRVF